MNKIIKNNTRGKTIQEPLRRYFITYAILIPLSLLFTFITIPAVELFFNLFFPGDIIYGGDELFTIFMPLLYILGSIILLIVFPFLNFISGFLISDRKLAFINSILLLILTNIWNVLLAQVNFAFAIISNLPMSIITSLFFAYFGYRVSSRRRLFQK